jgi:hypothetical protein
MYHWWPLSLSKAASAIYQRFCIRLAKTSIELNRRSVRNAASLLAQEMKTDLSEILERDSLPDYGHIINGWGDGTFGGKRISSRLDGFIHFDPMQKPLILQKDPEGEFHPWQSFAYGVMAGLSAHSRFSAAGITLGQLSCNSTFFNIDPAESHELGHALFALSFLDSNPMEKVFYLKGHKRGVDDLMREALDSHQSGSFKVCRKFHLTEGLCAMTARVVACKVYRQAVEYFLAGQLDMLVLLALMLNETHGQGRAQHEGLPSLVLELREALVLDNYIENYYYYAGHLLEVGTLALIEGYRLSKLHRNAMVFVANCLNEFITQILPHITFQDCFLHFGHYRRGITLLLECERDIPPSRSNHNKFRHYTVNFDKTRSSTIRSQSNLITPFLSNGIYAVARDSHQPRNRFETVLKQYAKHCMPTFCISGKYNHFRRISPKWWPRSFHYEFLDYGSQIGVEIHLESDWVVRFADNVKWFVPRLTKDFPHQIVEWDGEWWGKRGRLRVLFDDSTDAQVVAAAMHQLIKRTFSQLDKRLSRAALIV